MDAPAERPTLAPWGTVALGRGADGAEYWLPVLGEARYAHLGVFERKITIGDYSRDSDDIVSSWIVGDFSGGGQVEAINEGSDQQRFWWAVAETRYPNHVTLPPEVGEVPDPSGNRLPARPVGDVGGRFVCAFGAQAREWGGSAFAAPVALAAAPVGKGVAFGAHVFVPLGAAGHQRLHRPGGTLTALAANTDVTAVAFAAWDDKLFALEHDGQLAWTADGVTWAGAASDPPEPKLDASRTPRGLQSFSDRAGNPTLHVVTDRDVWAYDRVARKLHLGHLRFPRHEDFGLGAAVWRTGEDLWIAQGLGVTRYTSGGVVIPGAGLDRDDGLPAQFRGRIVDLEPEYNGLYALVQGDPGATWAVTWAEEGPAYRDDQSFFPAATAFATLVCWTGIGWHAVWASPDPGLSASWATVSAGNGEYRLWWGAGGSAFSLPLRRTFHNPKQGWRAGIDRFAASGHLETGRFDANMAGFDKIALSLAVACDNATPSERVRVSYETDRRRGWRELGIATAAGETEFRFDPDGDGFPEGERFGWLRLRFDLDRAAGAPAQTPVLDAAALRFVKVPQRTASYAFTVPLPRRKILDLTADEIAAHLDAMASAATLVPFRHGRRKLMRARVASVSGVDTVGPEHSGGRQVNLVVVDPDEDLGAGAA